MLLTKILDWTYFTDLQSVETVGLGRVGGDGVEDVDQDEEEGDQQGHPTLEKKGNGEFNRRRRSNFMPAKWKFSQLRAKKASTREKGARVRGTLLCAEKELCGRKPKTHLHISSNMLLKPFLRFQIIWSGFKSRPAEWVFFQAALQSSSELFRWLWNIKCPSLQLTQRWRNNEEGRWFTPS